MVGTGWDRLFSMPTPRDEISCTNGCAIPDDVREPRREWQNNDSRPLRAGREQELRVEMAAMTSQLERMAEAMVRLEERDMTRA